MTSSYYTERMTEQAKSLTDDELLVWCDSRIEGKAKAAMVELDRRSRPERPARQSTGDPIRDIAYGITGPEEILGLLDALLVLNRNYIAPVRRTR